MPKEHLSNVTEPWGHAGLQEDTPARQTRFYLLLTDSACGVFGASSSALPWRGSAGYWGAISPCLRNQGGWNSAPGAWMAGVVGLGAWPGAGGAGRGFVAAAPQPCACPCALLCAGSELGLLTPPKGGLRPSSP